MSTCRQSGCCLLAALAVCAGLAGCRGSLAKVNDQASILPASFQQVPLDLERIRATKLPALDLSRINPLSEEPSNDRDWVPEQQVLASAEFDGDRVTVHNVRNAQWVSYRDCLVDYYDQTYDLNRLVGVDFVQIPFNENRAIAHTLLSFAFDDGQHLGISIEVRLEKGESYSPAIGLFNQYELMYVVADERDLLPVRTEQRACDVYLYRTRATPTDARKLLVAMLERANALRDKPEFYHTLTNNCTTNIVRHVNQLVPGGIHYDYRVLLPGYADELAYELGLLDTTVPFAELKRRALINELADRYHDSPDFSARIRGERPRR
ncbi:MAG: DUF4105 domain-containing protein [Pirellulaceae bacterium]|nr:DUF4105 domain-containing protein [Pirellulaceae bacterium]